MNSCKNYIFTALAMSTYLLFSNNILEAKAAGVLPYCHDKQDKTHFYFAREAWGHDKGTYADFGGKFEQGDTAITAAAREFAEESMGIFHSRRGDQLNEQNIKNRISQKTTKCIEGKYTEFFIRVKNDQDTIFNTFNKTRADLKKKRVKSCLLEKNILISVKKEDLLEAVKNNNRFVKVEKSSKPFLNGKKVEIRSCTFGKLKKAYKRGFLAEL